MEEDERSRGKMRGEERMRHTKGRKGRIRQEKRKGEKKWTIGKFSLVQPLA